MLSTTAAFTLVGLVVAAMGEIRPRDSANTPARQSTAQTVGASSDAPEVRAARLVEIINVWLEAAMSGVVEDAANTKLVELRVGFPQGRTYSTKNLALEYRVSGKAHVQECGGYAVPGGRWFYVSKDKGVSKALDFDAGGSAGTIREMRLLFAVPKETAQGTLLFNSAPVGKMFELPMSQR